MREWRIELDEEEGELSAWLVFCDEKTIAAQLAFDNEPGENDWGFSKEDARQLVQFIVDACNEKEQREAGRPAFTDYERATLEQAEQRLRDLAEPIDCHADAEGNIHCTFHPAGYHSSANVRTTLGLTRAWDCT